MLVGQPDYTPFENDRLKWAPPSSEVAAPVLSKRPQEDFSFRKPAVLLFLAGHDSGSCCAANYERVVFRDKAVVALAKKRFVTVRLNRAGTKREMLKRYDVEAKRPALLVTDAEGEISGRFDLCANSRDVLKAMNRSLKASKTKAKVATQMLAHFDKVKQDMGSGSYRSAWTSLNRVLRLKNGPRAGAVRANRLLGEISTTGKKLYQSAIGRSDLTQRYDELIHLRHEFWKVDGLIKQIRRQISKLEDDETTNALIQNHLGNKLVNQALGLIKKGKARKGRGLLRQVRRDFSGTQAAERAQAELDKN